MMPTVESATTAIKERSAIVRLNIGRLLGRSRFLRKPASRRTIARYLAENLFERCRGARGLLLFAHASQAIDLRRIGDFAQRIDARRRNTDQQHLVAEANQVHLLAARERRAAQ